MYDIKFIEKDKIYLIGKQGSTNDGPGFISKLWEELNNDFLKIKNIIKVGADNFIVGIWGAMSSIDMSFEPWEVNYSKGLYLASYEVSPNAVAPLGFTRWVIPAKKYAYVKVEDNYEEVFRYVIGTFLSEYNLELDGAVQEYYSHKEGMQLYLYFPVK